LIVTISRDIDERRRQQALQVLQHAVTRQLAQTGAMRAVIDGVLAGIGPALQADRAVCVIVGADDGAAPQRLAAWQRDAAVPLEPRIDREALVIALGTADGQVEASTRGNDARYVVPIGADGRTHGALMLAGTALPPLPQVAQ